MRIKCPHCNGKGFSELNSAVNMTCGWCMGQGELDIEVIPAKEDMTNEEWFCTLSTEEKAEVLRDMIITDSYGFLDKIEYEEDWGCNGARVIEGWLKEIHE